LRWRYLIDRDRSIGENSPDYGASCGIGRAAATLFAGRGWNVGATMRNPEAEIELGQRRDVLLTASTFRTAPASARRSPPALPASAGSTR